jgi:hypothetical protein
VLEELADGVPQSADGTSGGLAQQGFELGEDLLDGIEIGAIGRQVEKMRADGLDRGAHGGALVGAEIVHDDDVAGGQRWHQELLDLGCEGLAVDRAVDHTRGSDGVVAQGGEEGAGRPVSVRDGSD